MFKLTRKTLDGIEDGALAPLLAGATAIYIDLPDDLHDDLQAAVPAAKPVENYVTVVRSRDAHRRASAERKAQVDARAVDVEGLNEHVAKLQGEVASLTEQLQQARLAAESSDAWAQRLEADRASRPTLDAVRTVITGLAATERKTNSSKGRHAADVLDKLVRQLQAGGSSDSSPPTN
jgi:hypothetical protein